MNAHVKVMPSGHEFVVAGNESLLEAGLRGGCALDYGCSNGNCGRCAVRIESGETRRIRHHDYALSEAAKSQGVVLSCCHTAVSDLVIEAEEAHGSGDIPRQEISLRLRKVERPTDAILIVNARTPRTRRLRFLAGQSATLQIPGVGSASYPIASCPCDDMNLQFHVPLVDNDPIVTHLARARHNDTIDLIGPHGNFVLNEASPNPLVFVASGAGFGPVKALIEHAMALERAPHITLLWLVGDGKAYLHNLCRSWHDALDDFTYVPHARAAGREDVSAGSIERMLSEHCPHALEAADYYAAVDVRTREAVSACMRNCAIASSQVHWHEQTFS